MTLWKWSQTAASNATADSTVNWQEGQAPGTVNNSARALMAAIAKFRDDLSCKAVTGGTSTAYTLTTNQVFTSLSDGLTIGFELDQDCGADPDINVDSLGAVDLIPYTGGTFAAGDLQGGGKYRATYDASGTAWIVHGSKNAVQSLAGGGTGSALTDPNADRILFWDDSAGAVAWLAPSTGLAISGTDISLSHLGIESLSDPGADALLMWDDSAGATAFGTFGDGLETSGTTVQANIASKSEMETGTATGVLVSVAQQANHSRHAKVLANISQTSTQSITADIGVSSISDGGTGVTTFNFDTAFANTTYYWFGTGRDIDSSGDCFVGAGTGDAKTTTSLLVRGRDVSAGAHEDLPEVDLVVFGDQA